MSNHLITHIDKNLASIISSISKSPSSWHGWSCVHIYLTDMVDYTLFGQSTSKIRAILETYLYPISGDVFFCRDQSIHIFCKGINQNILNDMCQYISDLLTEDAQAITQYHIYDIALNGSDYAQTVNEKALTPVPFPLQNSPSFSSFEKSFSLSSHQDNKYTRTPDNPNLRKVLLVEDDETTRWMVRKALKGSCHLATSPTANQSFLKILSFQPDLILLDINLPDKKGNAVLKWVKINTPYTNVVMFSSENDLDTISQTLEEGASAFIAKPFLKQQLLDCINSF